MITILNLISDTNIGGAGRVILNYLKYTDLARFRTLVAVPRGSALIGPLKEAGAEVHEVDAMADRSYSKEDVKVLTDFIRRVKPDLVHTHGCLSGRIAAKKCGLPVVYSRHSAFPVPAKLKYPPGRWVNRWLNQHYADRIIAVSPATMDNLVESGVSPKRITVVMNGVAPLTATTPEEQTALKKELGIGPDTVVFGILARIEEYKGHALIAQAARQLKTQGRDFKVLVAGTGQWAEELDRLVRELDVEDVMPRLGFRSDVAALRSVLDVQLNASFGTEAPSIALLEGLSLSKPSIVRDYGGNPWLVKDGDNGLVFPSRNSEALAAAMERLMDHPEQRQAMGRRAREIFEERFTGQVFARNTEQVYLEVLKGAH